MIGGKNMRILFLTLFNALFLMSIFTFPVISMEVTWPQEEEVQRVARKSLSDIPFHGPTRIQFRLLNSGDFGSYVYLVEADTNEKAILRVLNPLSSRSYRQNEISLAQNAGHKGISPKVLHMSDELDFYITEFFNSTSLDPLKFHQPLYLQKAASLIRNIHQELQSASYTKNEMERAFELANIMIHNSAPLPRNFKDTLWEASLALSLLFNEKEDLVSCHYDLNWGNFLHGGKILKVIDWECGGMGNRFIDLGIFSHYMAMGKKLDRKFLESYFQYEPSTVQRLKLSLGKRIFHFMMGVYELSMPFFEGAWPYRKKKFPDVFYSQKELDHYYNLSLLTPKRLALKYINKEIQFDHAPSSHQERGIMCLKSFHELMSNSNFANALKRMLVSKLCSYFLHNYRIDGFKLKKTSHGLDKDVFFVCCNKNIRGVLKIFSNDKKEELKLKQMQELRDKRVPMPKITSKKEIGDRLFVLFEYIEGVHPEKSKDHITGIAKVMAQLHRLPPPPAIPVIFIQDLEKGFEKLFRVCQEWSKLPFLAEVYRNINKQYTSTLPIGLLHGDISSSNILITRNPGIVLLDFDHMQISYFLTDIARALIFFGFDSSGKPIPRNIKSFLSAYHTARPLQKGEVQNLQNHLKLSLINIALLNHYRLHVKRDISLSKFEDSFYNMELEPEFLVKKLKLLGDRLGRSAFSFDNI